MPELQRYRNLLYDSARWWGSALRPGDMVVTAPPRCGSTATQAPCAHLVHDRTELGDVERHERRAGALPPPDLLASAHGGWAALR